MKGGPRYHVKPRRHREGRTDYRKRLKLLKSKRIRLVVRRSIKHTLVQFVEYNEKGDRVLVQAFTKDLAKQYGWSYSTSTVPAAYLTGLLAGKKAKDNGVSEVILDIGRSKITKGSKIFAVLQGVIDAGVSCPHDENMLPSSDRILGKHLKPELESTVIDIKNKILGG
ncbi:MAG: 50S ribosomal protein L18 [Candidatus Thermoplasmatota archaeon]